MAKAPRPKKTTVPTVPVAPAATNDVIVVGAAPTGINSLHLFLSDDTEILVVVDGGLKGGGIVADVARRNALVSAIARSVQAAQQVPAA